MRFLYLKRASENISHMIMSSIFDQMPQGRVNLGSCLHIAASKGHTEVVKLLLDRGADVNSKSRVSDMI